MCKIFTFFFCLMVIPSIGVAVQADLRKQLKKSTHQKVIKVVDGDTVILKDQTRVRLVGIEAPKVRDDRKERKIWPMDHASKAALVDLVLDKFVTLYFGGERRDRYGRALAHLFLDDGLWVQGEMLEMGMVRVNSFADNRAIVPEMMRKEQQARWNNRGIWALDDYQAKDHLTAEKYKNSFQLVSGIVADVAKIRGTYYLNFGKNWKEDFTIVIKPLAARKFIKANINPEDYRGKKIEVRGWLKSYNGPMINATHPEQITIIKDME